MTLDICVHEALKRQCELCLRDDEIAELKARIEKLEAALRNVMIGGNHLGLLIGARHPLHTASHEEAREHYIADEAELYHDRYEAWCCWRTIMEARAALEGR